MNLLDERRGKKTKYALEDYILAISEGNTKVGKKLPGLFEESKVYPEMQILRQRAYDTAMEKLPDLEMYNFLAESVQHTETDPLMHLVFLQAINDLSEHNTFSSRKLRNYLDSRGGLTTAIQRAERGVRDQPYYFTKLQESVRFEGNIDFPDPYSVHFFDNRDAMARALYDTMLGRDSDFARRKEGDEQLRKHIDEAILCSGTKEAARDRLDWLLAHYGKKGYVMKGLQVPSGQYTAKDVRMIEDSMGAFLVPGESLTAHVENDRQAVVNTGISHDALAHVLRGFQVRYLMAEYFHDMPGMVQRYGQNIGYRHVAPTDFLPIHVANQIGIANYTKYMQDAGFKVNPMSMPADFAIDSSNGYVILDHRYVVEMYSSSETKCPFFSFGCGEESRTAWKVFDVMTGNTVWFNGLLPHAVKDHHFFLGGKERVEPAKLMPFFSHGQ